MGNRALNKLPHHLMIITLPHHSFTPPDKAAGGLVKRCNAKETEKRNPNLETKEAEKRNPNLKAKETENEESPTSKQKRLKTRNPQPQKKRD